MAISKDIIKSNEILTVVCQPILDESAPKQKQGILRLYAKLIPTAIANETNIAVEMMAAGRVQIPINNKLPPPKAVALVPCAWKARSFRIDS